MIKEKIMTKTLYKKAVTHLINIDPDLEYIVSVAGIPPIWERPEGFKTLIKILTEQMLSVKAADCIFTRVEKLVGDFTPERLIKIKDEKLRECGLSNSKVLYCKTISSAVLEGKIDIDNLNKFTNQEVFKILTNIKGIGEWTANIYMMACLKRADIWPLGDQALRTSVQKIKKLPELPDKKQMQKIGELYTPYKSVAAYLFWQYYSSAK